MGRLLKGGERTVAAVEALKILPRDTAFFSDLLVTPARFDGVDARREQRDSWIAHARRRVQGCQLVFADPDNGLETSSVPPYSTRSPKYTYFAELQTLLRPEQSLVVYHHLARRPHVPDVQTRIAECSDHFQREAFALRFRRGSSRAFLIVPSRHHDTILKGRTERMLAGPWSAHFELIEG